MELKVSLDNITITAYIKPIKLLDLKSLIESHTAIIVQTAMTDMFRAITRDGSHVRLLLDYDKLKKYRSLSFLPPQNWIEAMADIFEVDVNELFEEKNTDVFTVQMS